MAHDPPPMSDDNRVLIPVSDFPDDMFVKLRAGLRMSRHSTRKALKVIKFERTKPGGRDDAGPSDQAPLLDFWMARRRWFRARREAKGSLRQTLVGEHDGLRLADRATDYPLAMQPIERVPVVALPRSEPVVQREVKQRQNCVVDLVGIDVYGCDSPSSRGSSCPTAGHVNRADRRTLTSASRGDGEQRAPNTPNAKPRPREEMGCFTFGSPVRHEPRHCVANGAGDENGRKRRLLHAPAEGLCCATCLVNRLAVRHLRVAGDLAGPFFARGQPMPVLPMQE